MAPSNPQKLALTSPTSGGRSRTQTTEFSFSFSLHIWCLPQVNTEIACVCIYIYIYIYIYICFARARINVVIAQFQINMSINCKALIHCMQVSFVSRSFWKQTPDSFFQFVIGHERARSLLFKCVLSISETR
jgi:hypothetical protein